MVKLAHIIRSLKFNKSPYVASLSSITRCYFDGFSENGQMEGTVLCTQRDIVKIAKSGQLVLDIAHVLDVNSNNFHRII